MLQTSSRFILEREIILVNFISPTIWIVSIPLHVALQSLTFYIPHVNASILLINIDSILNPNFIDIRYFLCVWKIYYFLNNERKKSIWSFILSDALLPLCFNRDVCLIFSMVPEWENDSCELLLGRIPEPSRSPS